MSTRRINIYEVTREDVEGLSDKDLVRLWNVLREEGTDGVLASLEVVLDEGDRRGMTRAIQEERNQEIQRYRVVDSDVAKRFTYGVVYSPNEVDSWGTYADEETIRNMCWMYMIEHQNINVEHTDGTQHHGVCVENHIHRGPSYELNGQTINPGAWLAGALWSEQAWAFIESGELTGWSMEGWAQMEENIAATGAPIESIVGCEFNVIVPHKNNISQNLS